MSDRTCSVDGCVGPYARISRGLCSKHYQRLRTHGSIADRPPRRWVICGHPECSRQAMADGLCRTHVADSDGSAPQRWNINPARGAHYCLFPECSRPHKVRGFCQVHNNQAIAHDCDPQAGPKCSKDGCERAALTRDLCTRHARFRYMTLRQYSITLDQYDALLASQGGRCAICSGVNADGSWLSVDHDHACCSGKSNSCGRCVRALLCGHCNLMIGQSGDDAARLRAGADYLDRAAPRGAPIM